MRKFWCRLGLHKLKYIEKYLHTSVLRCQRCNKRFLEGYPGELYKL